MPVLIRPVAAPHVVVPPASTYRNLNDSEVAAAVLKGSHETPAKIGLPLVDMETLLLSGMFCKECGQSFSLGDVDHIRGTDDKGEFFVAVVGTNQNKYFKVKTRMFKALF